MNLCFGFKVCFRIIINQKYTSLSITQTYENARRTEENNQIVELIFEENSDDENEEVKEPVQSRSKSC